MASTENLYTGNGSTTDYSFTFPYLKTTDIKASLDSTVTTAFSLANATTVRFDSAPGSSVAIRIFRATSADSLAATFYPGSAIRSQDLNDNFTQNLYVTQESDYDVTAATTTANTAKSTADTAKSTADTAKSTADTAAANATSAVSTANTASTNATNAVSTANTASTNATNAVSTANTASTNATTALNNSRESDGSGGFTSAITKANTAVSTANTASTNATNAVSTANTASTNASNAVSTANTASTNASNAVTTANAASAAVSAAVLYEVKANVSTWAAATYTEDGYWEIQDTVGLEAYNSGTTPKLTGLPATFQGATGLTVRLSYTHSSTTFAYTSYFANDPEDRFIPNVRPFGGTTTWAVKVATKNSFHRYNGTGHSSGFTIDGEQAPFMNFTPGRTYKFDQADSSNSGHVLKFYEEADKTTEYTTNVTTNGTPGSAGAYTQIVTSDSLPTVLHYQCSNHAYMGNAIQCNTAFDRTALAIIDAGNFDNATSTASMTNSYDGGNFDS